MALTLYHNPASTCSQKVRLALAEKGLDYVSHTIDWGRQEHLSDWYLALNPNGVVPTLVDGADAITDSSVICEYLEETWPQPPLAPADAIGRARMRSWMRYFEEVPTVAIRVPSFNRVFAPLVTSVAQPDRDAMLRRMPLRGHFYRGMGPDGFAESAERESLEKLRATLERVERALASGGPFLMGLGYTIADIVLLPTVVRMEDLGLAHLWSDLSAVDDWFRAAQARPSFREAYTPGARVRPQTAPPTHTSKEAA